MRIGVPREIKPLEGRVGLIPSACAELVRAGHEVFIEASAGDKSGYGNDDFLSVGVQVLPDAAEVYGRAEMVVKVKDSVTDLVAALPLCVLCASVVRFSCRFLGAAAVVVLGLRSSVASVASLNLREYVS